MNPLFFGESAAPMFGVFHPPVREGSGRSAVLLCPPLGQEYMRSHRALRQLALQLSREGVAVFRFDYRGTGDSSGEMDALSFATMTADARLALAELLDMSGARKAVVIGLRAGGIAALRIAADRAVSACVLWDPVVDGSVYADLLEAGVMEGDAAWHMGFPYASALRAEIRAQLLAAADLRKPTTIVAPEAVELRDDSGAAPDGLRVVATEELSEWWKTDNEGSLIVPGRGIRAVVEAVVGPMGDA